MKKVIFSLLCLTIGTSYVKAQENHAPVAVPKAGVAPAASPVPPPPPPPAPAEKKVDPDAGIFKFKEETHDYGEVPEGPLAETDFEFKNVGKKPINITEAHGSCGCTVPQWPHEPIMPGKKGVIHVAYTTQGRQGAIMKDVTINSDAQESPKVLHIRGTVKPKPVDPNAAPAQAPAPQGAPVAPPPPQSTPAHK